MMSIRLAAALAATLLTLIGPDAASATEPPTAIQSAEVQAAAVQDWLGRAATWSTPYTEMIDRRADLLTELLQGGEQVVALLNAGKSREARTWADRWAADQRAAMASDYDAFSALAPTPPALPQTIAMDSNMREAAQGMVELRDRIGTLLRQTQSSGDSYIELVVAATSGRAKDIAALDGGLYTVLQAHLDAEIVMLTSTRGPVGDPNYYFSNAMIEANRAGIAWLGLNRAIILGEPIDRAVTASRIRQHAALSREAADDMTISVNRTRRMLENEPDLVPTSFYLSMTPVLDSLLRSADVERQIADQNVALAAAIETNDAPAQDAIVAKTEALVGQRSAEFSRRRTMVAEMQ